MPTKKLILRLSSLGDVILATSALEALKPNEQVDWLICREYRELIEHHKNVRRVLIFDRITGFFGNLMNWVRLCRILWQENYTDVFDLHRSIRTRFCHILFIVWDTIDRLCSNTRRLRTRWHTVQKEKWKLYGLFVLKALWPKQFHPTPWVIRFARLLGGSGQERPCLTHLIPSEFVLPQVLEHVLRQHSHSNHYIAIMPSSRWQGKKWPLKNYVELLEKMHQTTPDLLPVILGAVSDRESFLLSQVLQVKKIPHFLGAGQWTLLQTAGILSQSQGYLGSDTGLAHLAEAVGVPVQILFGPTLPSMGFGPWRAESHSFGARLWCQPCGKDGRFCYRLTQRYACLAQLKPQQVLSEMSKKLT